MGALVVGVCADLDGGVADWRDRFIAALAFPAPGDQTATLQTVRGLVDAERGSEPANTTRGTQLGAGTGGVGEATTAGPVGPPCLGDVLSWSRLVPDWSPAGVTAPPAVTAGPVRPGSSLVLTDEPADELLERAVTASALHRRTGIEKVASRPHLRAAAVAEYLEQHPDR